MCATQLRICANLSPQVNQENSLADAEMEVAAWLEAAKQAAKRQAQGTQAWFEQNFHIRELERQLHHGRQLIASLQEVARHGSQTLRLLQNACKERDRLSHQLAVFKAQMPPPQPPSTRALWMGQLAAHATNEPPCEESLPPRESTPKPAPASAPQVPLTSLRIKFRKYKHEDQLKHNKPPWRLKVSLLVAKLSQQAVPAEPILQSPRPLGPTSFAGAAALLSAPLPTQQGGVAPQPMHQSIVQMLHVGGVRLGYVPVHRSACNSLAELMQRAIGLAVQGATPSSSTASGNLNVSLNALRLRQVRLILTKCWSAKRLHAGKRPFIVLPRRRPRRM